MLHGMSMYYTVYVLHSNNIKYKFPTYFQLANQKHSQTTYMTFVDLC